MKKLIVGMVVVACACIASADDYTNITVKINGQPRTIRARALIPDIAALTKVHGKRVGIEKDPIQSEVTWVFEDGHRETRKFPKNIINNASLFPYINRNKIEKFEQAKKNKEASK